MWKCLPQLSQTYASRVKKWLLSVLSGFSIFLLQQGHFTKLNWPSTLVHSNLSNKSICDYRKRQQVQVLELRTKNPFSSFISSWYSSKIFVEVAQEFMLQVYFNLIWYSSDLLAFECTESREIMSTVTLLKLTWNKQQLEYSDTIWIEHRRVRNY